MAIQIVACAQDDPDAPFDPQITVVRVDKILEDDKPFGIKTHTIGRFGSSQKDKSVTLSDGKTVITFAEVAEAIKIFADQWDTEGGNEVQESRNPRNRA